MKKIFGYVRVSSQDQAKSGLSINNQIEKIKQYAKLHDLKIDDIIIDKAESAKNLKRSGIQKILDNVKSNDVESIIIYKLDRLTRSLKDLNELIELFNKKSVNLCSIKDNLDTKSANGRMVINLLGTISQWEREVIGERTSEALQEKKRQNKRYGTIPYGKMLAADGVSLIKDEQELKVIDMISLFKNKGYSLALIANELNVKGFLTRKSTKFNKSNVNSLLRNFSYVKK